MRLGEKSSAGLAVVSWRDQLHLAWTGSDMRVNLATSPDGREITASQRLDQRSYQQETTTDGNVTSTHHIPLAPALAGSADRLYLAWTDPHLALNLLDADQPGGTGPAVLKERSRTSPSLASSETGSLALSWTGTDGHVNLLILDHYAYAPAAKTRLEQARSADAPAVCYHRGSPVLAWRGNDRRVNLMADATDPAGTPVRLEAARSNHGPALCHHRGGLALAWTGTDHRVNIMANAEEPDAPPVLLDGARTAHAPALCSHQGTLFAAWTGTDRRLNLAPVG